MTQSQMEMFPQSAPGENSYWLDFHIRLDGNEILEQVGFLVLIAAKFDGKVEAGQTKFEGGDGYLYGSAQVSFDNWKDWDAARAHCGNHLDREGCVHQNYVGALNRADPGGRMAKKLLGEIERAKRN